VSAGYHWVARLIGCIDMNEQEVLEQICESYGDEIKRLKSENELLKGQLDFERNIGKRFRALLVQTQIERDNYKGYNRNSDEVFGGINVYENEYLKAGEIFLFNTKEQDKA
jgi:hypothetical protein